MKLRPKPQKHFKNEEILQKYQQALELQKTYSMVNIARELQLDYGRVYHWLKLKVQPRIFRPLRAMSDVEKSFVAGVIEGEGNISLNLFQEKYVGATICIGNNSKELLIELQRIIGGETYLYSKRKIINRRQTYTLSLRPLEQIYDLLKAIQPYLISKKERAEVMMKYCESRFSHPSQNTLITQEEKELILKMGELNREASEKAWNNKTAFHR